MWGVRRIARSWDGFGGIKRQRSADDFTWVNTFRYKLAAYVISGVICGFAGFFAGEPAHVYFPRNDYLRRVRGN